tara:strand:+ start:494 stop:907 length:414 start_codon:yes stop_codon:yes gene_type:complete
MDSDVRHNSIRELARRLLRSKGVVIRHPPDWQEDYEDFSVKLSDISPSIYLGVEFTENEGGEIRIDLIGEIGGVLSKNQPLSREKIWIKDDDGNAWMLFNSEIFALAKAGYPGCLSCGGDEDLGIWDERKAREKMNQ